jgi:hypothetical protein
MTVTPPTSWTRDHRPMVRVMSNVSADAGVLQNYAEAVGLGPDVPPLPEVRSRVARAEGWSRLAWSGRGEAEEAIKAAQERALQAAEVDAAALADYVAVLERQRPWMDEGGEPGGADVRPRPALALAAARQLAQAERWRAGTLLQSATVPLYSRFAAVAAQAVEEVAGCLPLPPAAWSSLEPVSVLEADVLAVLQRAERRFNLAHAAGLHLRAVGLQGADVLQGDAPPLSLTFRRWAEASAHLGELRQIRQPLKLAYAVSHNWGPGVWLAADVRDVDQGPGPPPVRAGVHGPVRLRRGSGWDATAYARRGLGLGN